MVTEESAVRRYSVVVGARVERDPAIWVGVPVEFDHWGGDHRQWASQMAEACWADSGIRPGPYTIENLALRLAYFAEHAASDPLNHMYLHLPDPRMELASARIQVFEPDRMLDKSAAIRALVEADGALAVEEFTTSALGRGLRSRRYDLFGPGHDGPHEGFGMWRYGWHVSEWDVDVLLLSASSDLNRLEAMSGDLDALAHGISLEAYE